MKPILKLGQGQDGMLLTVIVTLFGGLGLGGSGQHMNSTHSCADQPFDMATAVFAAKRTILDSNTPIFTGRFEGVAVELLRVVDVDRLRNPGRRPNQLFQCSRDVDRFPAHTMIEMGLLH